MSVKELDGLLCLLAEKKRKMEQEEAETNMQILLDFLHCLRKQKIEELNEVLTCLWTVIFVQIDCTSSHKWHNIFFLGTIKKLHI